MKRMTEGVIRLYNCPQKAISAYVVPLQPNLRPMPRAYRSYGSPADAEQVDRKGRGQGYCSIFRLSEFTMGHYLIAEAVNGQRHDLYVTIKDGKTVLECESRDTFAAAIASYRCTFELPEMHGTEAQIDWATSIRNCAIVEAYPLTGAIHINDAVGKLLTGNKQAAWWIEQGKDGRIAAQISLLQKQVTAIR